MKTHRPAFVAAVCLLALTFSTAALAMPEPERDRADRLDGEDEEIRERIEWFYGRRGLLDGGIAAADARKARANAALDVNARTLEQGRHRAPTALWTSIGPAPMTMMNW